MKRAILILGALALLLCGTAPARAGQILTFEGLGDGVPIPNGYGGFNWQNFYVLDGTHYSISPSGYHNGRVSGDYVAFNAFGDPASLIVNSANPFTFNSVYLTAAWNNGLNIKVDGYLNGLLVQTRTVTVDTFAPTLFTFDWTNIDSLKFTSSGGTDAGYGGGGEHFAMDNFATDNPVSGVPEPSSLALFGMATASFAGYFGWRRRKLAVGA